MAVKLSNTYVYGVLKNRTIVWKLDKDGYYYSTIKLMKRAYTAYKHVYVFFNAHGYIPERVDHKDGNILNNDLDNLRAVTASENNWNRKLNSNSTTGIKGVTVRNGKFVGQVQANGRKYSAGSYNSLAEAETAVTNLRNKLHGEFARNI